MPKPNANRKAVLAVLRGDSELKTLMGLASATALVIKHRIIGTQTYRGKLEPVVRLCVYYRPSRKAPNGACTEEVLQIDCYAPAGETAEDGVADDVQERVSELLHSKSINNHRFWWGGQLGELPAEPDFICIGARYTFETII